MVNTILKEADLFYPNSVRINFTIYLMINRNHVLMGWLIILCGILNFVFVSFFGILSGLLIVIAGGLALRK
ncbi:hypothetical protein [Lactiplantibacillus plantarum]